MPRGPITRSMTKKLQHALILQVQSLVMSTMNLKKDVGGVSHMCIQTSFNLNSSYIKWVSLNELKCIWSFIQYKSCMNNFVFYNWMLRVFSYVRLWNHGAFFIVEEVSKLVLLSQSLMVPLGLLHEIQIPLCSIVINACLQFYY